MFNYIFKIPLILLSMIKKFYLLFFFPLLCFGQSNIGDIEYDETIDKRDFKLCNSSKIYQYFNNSKGLEYKGDKTALEKEIRSQYKSAELKGETGSIRVRFVVNCEGETDRFRLIAMDSNYLPKVFDKSITDQLLQISKNLKGWKPKSYREDPIDYYQYLIFKLTDGHITHILP